MMTEQTAKPKKLFAITITVYTILAVLISAACFFVKYPISYTAALLKGQTTSDHNLKLDYYVISEAKLNAEDQVVLTAKTGERYEVSISNISKEKDRIKVTLLMKSNQQFSSIAENKVMELTKHQRLFLLLVNKLN